MDKYFPQSAYEADMKHMKNKTGPYKHLAKGSGGAKPPGKPPAPPVYNPGPPPKPPGGGSFNDRFPTGKTGKIGNVKVPSGYKPQKYAWSSRPPGPGMPGWKAPGTGKALELGRYAKGVKGPVIRGNARVFLVDSKFTKGRELFGPAGYGGGQQGGALGRTHYEVMKHHRSTTTAQRAAAHSAKLAKTAKIVKGANIFGLGMIAAEGIYKGTKRALGPGGTEFHTKKSKNKYGTKGY